MGGEEFLVVIQNADLKMIETIYQSINQSLKSAQIEGLTRAITLSGGATKLEVDEVQHELLKRADNALYQAKEQGRERLIFL